MSNQLVMNIALAGIEAQVAEEYEQDLELRQEDQDLCDSQHMTPQDFLDQN